MKPLDEAASAVAKLSPSGSFIVMFWGSSGCYLTLSPDRTGADIMSWICIATAAGSAILFFTKCILNWPPMKWVDGN